MKTTTRSAFSAFELLIVIVTVMLVAAAILPYFSQRRVGCTARINCVNNLKQVGLAFRMWALDNNDKHPMAVSTNVGGTMELIESGYAFHHFRVMSNELSTPKILMCPEETDRWRVLANTFAMTPPGSVSSVSFTSDKNLSYFVGVDAGDDLNPNMILTGDHWMRLDGKPAWHGLHTATMFPPTRGDDQGKENQPSTKVAWYKSPPEHNGGSNIGLADGSVQQFTSARLSEIFLNQNTNQCRLAFP